MKAGDVVWTCAHFKVEYEREDSPDCLVFRVVSCDGNRNLGVICLIIGGDEYKYVPERSGGPIISLGFLNGLKSFLELANIGSFSSKGEPYKVGSVVGSYRGFKVVYKEQESGHPLFHVISKKGGFLANVLWHPSREEYVINGVETYLSIEQLQDICHFLGEANRGEFD